MKKLLFLFLFLFPWSFAWADTTTTNLGLTLPTTSTADVWGAKINTNFLKIDSSAAFLNSNNSLTGSNSFSGVTTASNLHTSTITFNDASTQITAFSSGTISITSATISHLIGTTGATSATVGTVGEYTSSVTAIVANTAANGVYEDLLAILLTPGDWDIVGFANITNNGATWTLNDLGLSTTSGNSSTGLIAGQTLTRNSWASSATTPVTLTPSMPFLRASLASNTTYYLKIRADFSANGPPQTQGGGLFARRVR